MLLTRRRALEIALAGCVPSSVGWAAGSPEAEQEKRITLALDKAPLATLAKELTRQSGGKHRVVGREANRPLLVAFCRDQTAASVRDAVAELLGWSWVSETANGERMWTLLKDVKAQQSARALRTRYLQQYRGALARMVDAAADPDWKPRSGEILDYQIAAEDSGAVLRGAAALPESVRNAVLDGRPYVVRAGTLSGAFGEVVRKAWSQVAEGRALHAEDPVRLEVVRDDFGRPDYFQLTVGRVQFRAGHAGFVYPEAMADTQQEQATRQRMLITHPELSIRLPKRPPLRWSGAPAPEPSYLGWHFRDLSRRVDRNFLADYYDDVEAEIESGVRKPFPPFAMDGKRLSGVLDELSEPHYQWRVENEWVLLRYRWWYWEAVNA